MRHAARWFLVIPLLLAVQVGVAAAQDRATARKLFAEGKRLVDAGDYAAACVKFADSAKLDPTIGTKLAVAACHERIGRTASAWAEFREVEAMATRAGAGERHRRDYAAEHARALEPTLSRLEIVVDSTVPGLVVTRDGQAVGAGELGAAVPVDPGEHLVAATARDHHPWSQVVRVDAQRVSTVRVPPLRKIEVEATTPAPPPPVARPEPSVSPPRAPAPVPRAALAPEGEGEGGSSTRKIIGYSVGAGGLALVGVGVAFGASARSKWNDAKAQCSGSSPLVCPPEAVELHDDAESAANISTITVAAGLVAIAGGVTLLLWPDRARAPERVQVVPSVVPSGAALAVTGGF